MFRGTVKFRARIVDTKRRLTIPEKCEFNPNKTGVEKVEIECANGTKIVITVHFASVDNEEVGIAVAEEIHKEILDRVSIARGIAIENGRVESALSPTDGQSNVITPRTGDIVLVGEYVKVSLSLSCVDLNPILEDKAPRGAHYFGLFRSALLSTSQVEEFMHLYNILLMLFNDEQTGVDKFILRDNPGVPLTPHPRRKNRHESVYTRLRNEFGHPRQGVNLDNTKAEMKKRLDELITLTKRAIELHP